jgi:hypothetical protein
MFIGHPPPSAMSTTCVTTCSNSQKELSLESKNEERKVSCQKHSFFETNNTLCHSVKSSLL